MLQKSVSGTARAIRAIFGPSWLGAIAAVLVLSSTASAYVLISPPNAWIGPDIPVVWRLNTTLNDATIANEFEILRGGFDTWEGVANFDLQFLEGATTTACGLQQNGQNSLSMTDCFNQCTGGCLAVTSTILFQFGDGFWNTNTVSDTLLLARQESDITWTDSVNWGDYRDWPGCPGEFDLWGVTVHEQGHFIGLGHSATFQSTMFASVASCDSTKASLHPDDRRGGRALYRTGTRVAASDLGAGLASLTVTNKGNLGFTGSGGKIGTSFQWAPLGAAQHVFECSFAMAEVGGTVSDNFRNDSANAGGDGDLQQSSDLAVLSPGAVTAEEAAASFDDSRAPSPYGVDVDARFFADDAAANEDFVIIEYVMTNNGGSPLVDFRAGLFMDADFNDQFALNVVNYDAANDMAYVSTANTTSLFGIAVLNTEGAAAMRALFATDTTAPEAYSDANKQTWMSAGFERTTLGPADIALMIASGDFDIAVGATANVAFALIGGSSLADLQANAATARALYQGSIKGTTTSVEDGIAVLPIADFDSVTPNPFGRSTRLDYTLYTPGVVRLDVLDASGRLVRTLVQSEQAKGTHSVVWDGTDGSGRELSSGVYFTKLATPAGQQTRKVHFIR